MLSSSYKLVALLLLHAGGSATGKKKDLCEVQSALTCAGGGYRAYASCAGLTAGLLTAVPSGTFDELFANVDAFAAVSGGSWWATGMVYSGEMPAMHEAMAASPMEAGKIFHSSWSVKTGPNRGRRMSEEHLPPFDSNLCQRLAGGPGKNFERYVQQPTSIPGDAALSLKPKRSWAQGKLFLVLGSVPTPGSGGRWEKETVWVHFTFNATSMQYNGSIYYAARSPRNDTFPLYAPVRWSFVLGDEPEADAPLPFCGDEDCNGLLLEYVGYSSETEESFTAYSPPLGSIFQTAFGDSAGMVLLDQVTGTSSAALGSVVLDPNTGGFPPDAGGSNGVTFALRPDAFAAAASQLACTRQAVWTDREREGIPFTNRVDTPFMNDNVITQELMDDTAYSGLQALIDGAWTDNTGITASISAMTSATGCTGFRPLRVTALLNGELVEGVAGLPNLFPGANKSLGPICSSPTHDEVMKQVQSSTPMPPPLAVNYTPRLHGIRYGSIRCKTTDNPYYGVKGGFMVEINFILAESAEPITPKGGWSVDGVARFGELAGEIVETMVSNNETVMAFATTSFPKAFEETAHKSAIEPTSSPGAGAVRGRGGDSLEGSLERK